MNKVQTKRLLNVAKALRESPDPEHFTMSVWGHGCGTPACALGHYAARQDLQRTFNLVYNTVDRNDGKSFNFKQDLEDHFGLTFQEAIQLFGSYGCGDATTPRRAASYIERFVKQKEKRA